SSFSKEGLVAVSGKDESTVGEGLSDLVRRDVLQVSADPLSPERGSYRFSQEMLRQVAYETLSRTDRKLRHLAAASHLRGTFAEDGEEVADAIARHYLDALAAVPSGEDREEITAEALGFLVRGGDRSAASGALQRAAASYSSAAALAGGDEAAELYEKAAVSSLYYDDHEAAISFAEAAIGHHMDLGELRGAARARGLRGSSLNRAGRTSEGRAELKAALEVLSLDPDSDTVAVLSRLAGLESTSGNFAEGERLASEGLALAQGLDVGPVLPGQLFLAKGSCAASDNRLIEAAAYFEAAGRLGEAGGDPGIVALSQGNLADVFLHYDPKAAIEPARSSAAHAKRTGRRNTLAAAITNIVIAEIEIGHWDEASATLSQAIEEEHLDHLFVHLTGGLLAGLRGDDDRAATAAAAIEVQRSSGDAQDKSYFGLVDVLTSLSAKDQKGALSHGLSVLELREVLGIGADAMRFSWPLSARAARSLGDNRALEQLLAMLDEHPVGHLPPVLRAGRKLVKALVDADAALAAGGSGATSEPAVNAASLGDAISALREVGNPYELAHGLLDYAGTLARAGTGDGGADETSAAAALAEA
ncbi:MAG: hypothetical protein ACRD0B_06020, partial [Acidimicrobiales bacterium]